MRDVLYLCLSELLDQDPSAYEYFQTLPPEVRDLLERDDGVTSFSRLQSQAAKLRAAGLMDE